MRPILAFSMLLLSTITHGFAQENKVAPQTDSTKSGSDKATMDALSGYASRISADNFNQGAVFSPLQLIQGKVPGFVINCLNVNDPNPDLQIQSRGISTLYLNTDPMYVIDGIRVENPDVVPVGNIESIEVLKSLSETAPYGIRGGNGVILIKTKSNNSKPLTVTYNTYAYGETYAKKSSYMSVSEWRNLKQAWLSSPYFQLNSKSTTMRDYNANTNWRKEVSQYKLSDAHHLGFFGGYKKTSYSAMLNYNDYKGIIQKTGNTIYSGQISASQLALKDKLQVNISVMGTLRKYCEMNDNPYLTYTDSNTGLKYSNIVSYANRYNPTIPVYNNDGTYGMDTTYYSYNPLSKINNTVDNRESRNTLLTFRVSYEIVKGLKFSASWSKNKTFAENSFSNAYQNTTANQYLAGQKETRDQKERLYSVKLIYTKSLASHSFDIGLNYSGEHQDFNYNYHDSIIQNGTQPIIRNGRTSDGYSDVKNLSGTVKYNYKNKYYVSFDILEETSPFYNWDKSAQYFPSFSAAWSLKNENFLANASWLNELKIRSGYGVGQRMIKLTDNAADNSFMPNSQLHGEKMKEEDVGIDVCLLSGRLYFSADYYQRKTKDGIVVVAIPYPTPFYLRNEPEIQNKGWEFYVKAQPFINQLKWKFDFNISFNKNKLLSNIVANNGVSLNEQEADNFYGPQFAGYSSANDILFYDNNGNTSTDWYDYKKKLGNGVPKSLFGLTNNFEYKNFELSIFIRGGLGFEIANSAMLDEYKKVLQSVDQRDILNASFLNSTDYVVEKGDYAKISYVSFGYMIPIDKKIMKSVRVYVACNNVALFTKARDVDPEKAGINGIYPGKYYYEKYPDTRIFLLGLNVSF